MIHRTFMCILFCVIVAHPLIVHNYPHRDYLNATCVSLGKKIDELTDKMLETMNERIVE